MPSVQTQTQLRDSWIESLRIIWRDENLIGLQDTLDAVDAIGIHDDAIWSGITDFLASYVERGTEPTKFDLLKFVAAQLG